MPTQIFTSLDCDGGVDLVGLANIIERKRENSMNMAHVWQLYLRDYSKHSRV